MQILLCQNGVNVFCCMAGNGENKYLPFCHNNNNHNNHNSVVEMCLGENVNIETNVVRRISI